MLARDLSGRLRRPSWLVSEERRDLDSGSAVFLAWRTLVRRLFHDDSASPSQAAGMLASPQERGGACS